MEGQRVPLLSLKLGMLREFVKINVDNIMQGFLKSELSGISSTSGIGNDLRAISWCQRSRCGARCPNVERTCVFWKELFDQTSKISISLRYAEDEVVMRTDKAVDDGDLLREGLRKSNDEFDSEFGWF